ncbi:MFS transporter [Actinomadura sp. ATCC 39365]
MSLWKNRDFLKLWTGDTVSEIGNQVTTIAMPLLAILVLHASPAELGILGAAQFAPYLVFGLVAGVWVDRLRRRPLMIISEVLRAVCIGLVPLLAALDLLLIEHLYVIVFVFGTLGLFFDVAYQSYLPTLVGREELTEGNAKMTATATIAQVSGPGAAGVLVQIVTAPAAMIIDAASFLLSALGLALIKKREEPVPPDPAGRNLLREVREGLAFVLHNRYLRVIAATTATSNFFGRILFTVYVLYLTEDLRLAPSMVGLSFAVSGAGSVLGSFLTERGTLAFGLGRTIAWGLLIGNAALLLIPAAPALGSLTVPVLLVSMFVWGFSNPVYNINQVSLRQGITPDRLLGRMSASMRFLVWGTVPLGYVAGGALGEAVGLWPTLLIGAIGGLLPAVWLLPSRLIALTDAEDAALTPAGEAR